MDNPTKLKHFEHFMRIWKGQTLSAFGAQMTQFALSLWIFNETGSVVLFGLIIAAQLVPTLLLTPIAGMLVDRFDRRRLMLICEGGLIVVSSFIYAMALMESLTHNMILLMTPIIAIFGILHQLAYTASIGLLVTKPFYEKASALIQLGINTTAIVVPLISVVVLDHLGLSNVILINVLCYFYSTYTLIVSRYPYPMTPSVNKERGLVGLWNQVSFGFTYLRRNGGLKVLLLAACMVSFIQGSVHTLFRPLLLIDYSNSAVGWVVTFAGVGGFVGSILAGNICSRYDKTHVVVVGLFGCCSTMFLCALMPGIILISSLAFLFSMCMPIILVASQSIWLNSIPKDIQGKVFSTNALYKSLSMMVAVILCPGLASGVFEPILLNDKENLSSFGVQVTDSLPIQLVLIGVAFFGLLVAFSVHQSSRLKAFRLQQKFEQASIQMSADKQV